MEMPSTSSTQVFLTLFLSLFFHRVLASSNGFTLAAYYTNFPGFGTPLINANGGYFWAGKPTASYCPDTVANVTTCPPGNVTSFAAGKFYGTLALNTIVPGGQQVYINPAGLLAYTVPHSGYIPPGSVTTGLLVNETTMQLNRYYTFWLCNQETDAKLWRVGLEYEDEQGSIKIGGQTGKNACTRFQLHAEEVEGVGAWEYT